MTRRPKLTRAAASGLAVASVALLLSVLGAAPSAAKLPAHKTAVSARFDLSGSADWIKGRVTSPKRACTRNRPLTVLRDPDYDGPEPYAAYAKASSNRRGRYSFDPPEPIPNGDYKIKLAPKRTSKYRCRGSVSVPVFVD